MYAFNKLELVAATAPKLIGYDSATLLGTCCSYSIKGIVSPDWKGLLMFSLDRFEV
jgi:hypothetical protein